MGKAIQGLQLSRPAAEVLKPVLAVPTILPHLDHVIGVGGWPLRLSVVHGPSNEGKSTLCLGLIRSFLEAGHFALFCDAERSTPEEYARMLLGECYDWPTFSAVPIRTYEQVRAAVREWCDRIALLRKKGEIPDDATGIVVVDSLKSLMPATMFEELAKATKAEPAAEEAAPKRKGKLPRFKAPQKHVDGAGGRGGQIQASLHAAWFTELVSLLDDTRTALVAIAREDVVEDGRFVRYEVRGGKAVKFDPSLRVRIQAFPRNRELAGGEVELEGYRHIISVYKTKVGRKKEQVPHSVFHTTLDGFDRAADVLELGRDLEVIQLAGSWYSYGSRKLGQGERAVIEKLRADVALLQEIELACRQKGRES